MSKRTLLRVRTYTKNQWLSCRVIEEAYSEVFNYLGESVTVIDTDEASLSKILTSLQSEEVHLFLSSPDTDLKSIFSVFDNLAMSERLHIILPVYGNMTDKVNSWKSWESLLRGKKVSFLCSGHALLKQTQKFVLGDVCKLIPYPISEKFYNLQRVDDPSRIRLIYAGRIALGKNIFELIQSVQKAALINEKITLEIYGDFSFEGHHFHGLNISQEELKQSFFSLINNDQNVTYKGHASQVELAEAFSRSDYFVSLSTYHDEDFGVAAAQAQAGGLCPILSAWGGHLDFETNHLIPIFLNNFGIPIPDVKEFVKVLLTLDQMPLSNSGERFSAKEVARLFLNIMEEPKVYLGQTDLFNRYQKVYLLNMASPYRRIKSDNDIQALYHEVYQSYGLN